jgi:hypothetical protein
MKKAAFILIGLLLIISSILAFKLQRSKDQMDNCGYDLEVCTFLTRLIVLNDLSTYTVKNENIRQGEVILTLTSKIMPNKVETIQTQYDRPVQKIIIENGVNKRFKFTNGQWEEQPSLLIPEFQLNSKKGHSEILRITQEDGKIFREEIDPYLTMRAVPITHQWLLSALLEKRLAISKGKEEKCYHSDRSCQSYTILNPQESGLERVVFWFDKDEWKLTQIDSIGPTEDIIRMAYVY